MNKPLISKIVIVGGGSAGWMTAAALAKMLGTLNHEITLIESDQIGIVGVGEATIPTAQKFNRLLGIDETEFLRETNGSIKLGIQFVNWRRPGVVYFHPFGVFGEKDEVSFQHYWLRLAKSGGVANYEKFNVETQAAAENRFGLTGKDDATGLPNVYYAYHFDARLYADYLRRYAEHRGVRRQEGTVVDVTQHPETGFVTSIRTNDGKVIEGDMFIDCSGFRGLLTEQVLQSGYEDWSHWLPCNRAAAVQSECPEGAITPYTRATAYEAGWQWRIPLQKRIGAGYVFCNDYISEDEACVKLLMRIDGRAVKDPWILKFVTGHRKRIWNKNVVAIGLAGGFLEPLESTSIHLGQIGIMKLLKALPRDGFCQSVTNRYNEDMLSEYVNVRDFIIAHYKLTEREDTPFWVRCKNMDIPESLSERLEMFKRTGTSGFKLGEVFGELNWFYILMGQGFVPESYHPAADVVAEEELKLTLARIRTAVTDRIRGLPTHNAFLNSLSSGG